LNIRTFLRPTISVLATVLFCANTFAFDAGEHALIGDTAFLKAAGTQFGEVANLEMDVSYRYGQLVAMSGDMYQSIEEIALSDSRVMKDFFKRNRGSLKKCVDLEIESIRTAKVYSGCDDVRFATKKIRYVTLAHDNYSHFAWHNIKHYIDMHGKALWFAKLAYLKCTPEQQQQDKADCEAKTKRLKAEVSKSNYKKKLKSKYRKLPKLFPRKRLSQRYFIRMKKEKMIRLALFANAFADHYLSDAFSAGHLRVPRSQIDTFVNEFENSHALDGKGSDKKDSDKSRGEGSAVSGALTQFLHNNDGTLTGINVTNSLGDNFVIRSDKQLFAAPGSAQMSGIVEKNSQLQQPSEAVYQSLKEVFDVIEQGEAAMPKGVYAGFLNVPFIADNEKFSLSKMIERNISQHGSIRNAIKSMSTEMQLVFRTNMAFGDVTYKEYFARFIADIPTFMASLREQVKAESEDKAIKSRLPVALLNALKGIR
jgi:hypothetical protein